jgi:EAL domain-containing protein (putative c-di-GMP-specific phosphodiesterase class I)
VAIIGARLPSHTRSGIGLSARQDRYEGRFHRLQLHSVFQPIVSPASGATLGHEAFVRCGEESLLSPWNLFSLAASNSDPDWLVALDRLCRTLHATNYFDHAEPGQRLFLSVQPGLVAAVARDHGQVFGGILRLLGIDTRRVVIQLPASINHDLSRLRAVGDSFLARGFGLALTYGGENLAWLRDLAFAHPVILRINPATLPTDGDLGHLADACRRHQLSPLIRHIESAADRGRAIAAGADALQGHAFGHPTSRPLPGLP